MNLEPFMLPVLGKAAMPQGAVIEIIERTDSLDRHGTIVPNEVRLNGQPLLCSADEPVIVHEVSTSYPDVVRVTLTLFARRVTYGTEPRTTDATS